MGQLTRFIGATTIYTNDKHENLGELTVQYFVYTYITNGLNEHKNRHVSHQPQATTSAFADREVGKELWVSLWTSYPLT